MKISAFATALLFASPFASAASLRNNKEESNTSKLSKAQLVVHGVKGDFSDADLAIITQTAIAAYKAVQKNDRYSINSITPLIHFGVDDKDLKQGCQLCPPDDDAFLTQGCQLCPPDDDSFKSVVKGSGNGNVIMMDVEVGQGCQLCPPDDDAFAFEATSTYKDFTQSFCSLLTRSGSANLANSHSCHFTFLEEPGHKVAPLQLKKTKDEQALGFLSVRGLLHDLSAKDIAMIEKYTIATYNQAFANTGYSLEAINARGSVETPKSNKNLDQGCQLCPPDDDALKQGCQLCPPDDDSFLTHGVANIVLLDAKVAGLSQGCQLCPPDDDAVLSTVDLERANKAFGKALCTKLRNSGSPNLAFADGCSMDFLYEHATTK